MRNENNAAPPATILITICDRGQEKKEKVTELFKSKNSSFNLMTLGKGTASSKILNYLGLGETEKSVLFSVMTALEAEETLTRLDEKLDLQQPGHGIAFTLPLDGLCLKKAVVSVSEEDEKGMCTEVYDHSLIIAITNRGYADEVMDAARSAQALGGTIIHAKGFAFEAAEKFFGLTIQPEKEIIMILAPTEKKGLIMQAIADKSGAETDAGAITLSLPVSSVRGLTRPLPKV